MVLLTFKLHVKPRRIKGRSDKLTFGGIHKEIFLKSCIGKGLLYPSLAIMPQSIIEHHFSHPLYIVWVRLSPSQALEIGIDAGLANHSLLTMGLLHRWTQNLSQDNQRKSESRTGLLLALLEINIFLEGTADCRISGNHLATRRGWIQQGVKQN